MSYPKVLTKRMEDHPTDSHTIERYEATGGYVQAKGALDMTRDELVDMVSSGASWRRPDPPISSSTATSRSPARSRIASCSNATPTRCSKA